MSNRIKNIRVKNLDGSIDPNDYFLTVNAAYVDMANERNVQETIGTIDIEHDGNIAQQLGIIQNELGKIENKIFTFDRVKDMKQDNSLRNGSYVVTLGYYAADDGGGACYHITATRNDKVYQELLDSGLYATLMTNNDIYVNQIGCKGDGIFDNSELLNWVFSQSYFKKIKFNSSQVYLCNSTVTVTKEYLIEGNFATIRSGSSGIGFAINSDSTSLHRAYAGTIENLNFEGPKCNVLFEDTYGCKGLIRNCTFTNFYNIGLRHESGYETVYENLRFWGKGVNSIGIQLDGTDVHFNNIFMCDCHTGILLNGLANFINNFHAWILDSALYKGSKQIEVRGWGTNYISQFYIDSYNYGIYNTGGGHIVGDTVYCLFHKDWSAMLPDKDTSFIYYTSVNHALKDWDTSLTNITLDGDYSHIQFANLEPEYIAANLNVIAADVAYFYQYSAVHVRATYASNIDIYNKEITRSGDNLIHISLQGTINNAVAGNNLIASFPWECIPKNPINVTGFISTDQHMANPSPVMFTINEDIKVYLENAGTQYFYLNCDYLARNGKGVR